VAPSCLPTNDIHADKHLGGTVETSPNVLGKTSQNVPDSRRSHQSPV